MGTPVIFWFDLVTHLAILVCWINFQTQPAIAQFARLRQLNSQTLHQTHRGARPALGLASCRLLLRQQ